MELPKIRALDYPELREIMDKGLDPQGIDDPVERGKVVQKLYHHILDNCFKDCDFRGVPYLEALKFAQSVYLRTIGSEADEKN